MMSTWSRTTVPGQMSRFLEQVSTPQTPTATIVVTTEGGVIKGANWALRGDLGKIRVPLRRLTPNLEVTLDLSDLSGVKFPTMTNTSTGGANHSEWIEGISCVDSAKNAGALITDKSEIAEIPFMKDTGFSLR